MRRLMKDNTELKIIADELFLDYIKPYIKCNYNYNKHGYRCIPEGYVDCIYDLRDKMYKSLKRLASGVTDDDLQDRIIIMFRNEMRLISITLGYQEQASNKDREEEANGWCEEFIKEKA